MLGFSYKIFKSSKYSILLELIQKFCIAFNSLIPYIFVNLLKDTSSVIKLGFY